MTSDAVVRSLVVEILGSPGPIVVLTGAGVSVASGIAPFRGSAPNAVWKQDLQTLATERYFKQEPVRAWQWFHHRFAHAAAAAPNPAHHAAAALERWQVARGGEFLVVTQNIDTLHERAGSLNVVKVHGSADRIRCSSRACPDFATTSVVFDPAAFEPFLRTPSLETIPRCPRCGALMRPHVLFFDETYDSHASYQWSAVASATDRMRLLIAVGTSFSVGVTEYLLSTASSRRVPIFIVDPARPAPLGVRSTWIAEPAEVVLPELVAALHQHPEDLAR